MSALLVFASAFVTVFCLGLQSQNVNQGHYVAAVVTSFFISTGSIFLYEYMAVPTMADKLGFYVGASSGIAFSIWFHKNVKAWWQARRARRVERRLANPRGAPCGRCGDGLPFACHRPDCPRLEGADVH